MQQRRKFKLTLSARNKITGLLFISPFILGFLLFFLPSIVESFIFSFSSVTLMEVGYKTSWIGWDNYETIFMKNAQFSTTMFGSLTTTLTDTFLILIISFFAALLLNQKFKGRTFARAVFFLPVIISSGILLKFEENTMAMLSKTVADSQEMASGETAAFISYNLLRILKSADLNQKFIDFIMLAIDNIYAIITRSGVQILIFLSALQTVDPSLKEAAHMDGATGWEFFWKITFPMVSSYILVNLVYTMIDSFTNPVNEIMELFNDTMFVKVNFSLGSAMGWAYFAMIIVTMGTISLIISRRVYYEE